MTEVATVPSRDEIEEAMREVVDPELGINVVDLGLVYDLRIDGNQSAGEAVVVTLDMTLTSAPCPLTEVMEAQPRTAVPAGPKPLADVLRINWVWMPPWGPDKITDDGRE